MDSVPFSAWFGEHHFTALLPGVLNCRCCSSNVSRKRTMCFCTQYNASEPVPLCVVLGLRLYDTKSCRRRHSYFRILWFYRIPLYIRNWRITPYTLSCTLSLYGLYYCCNVLYDCLTADSMSTHYVLPLYSFLIKSAIVLESSTTTGRATIVARARKFSTIKG